MNTEERFSRQRLFHGIGRSGQKKLEESHVIVIGAGALGSLTAESLVRAGIGRLTLIDRDYVEVSNLQRQQLYTEADAAAYTPKAEAAKRRLLDIRSNAVIDIIVGEADPAVLENCLPADLIIDGLDNMETRLMINDTALKHRIPWIYGACVGAYGLSYTVTPEEGPCLRCLMKGIPMEGETCDTMGIIAPAVQFVSATQVTEAMKLLTHSFKQLRGTLWSFDVWSNESSSIRVDSLQDVHCPSCGESPTYPALAWSGRSKAETLCGRDAVQVKPLPDMQVSLERTADAHKKHLSKANQHLLVLNIENKRLVLFKDGRAIIHGVSGEVEARSLYQRYIGG
ncbi:thiamine biosynthesis protein MoeB [Marinococcus halophilus]|uniref:Thiazole biosynthesis adenylyltransferase ThiF n=1 Tax=Marinococcus halophilus TaxID=1371 RepID=A0A510Y2I7_MARHA|nr:ThiF family adenylyltransferase [Marinococcus halophilus]OZT81590.1 thiamine biosynthesis protein MoeB [Marinococcus halophilus]GEK57535.1 thiazole biosynthesis adenylyltransferase ThiF [Marinococcus halophilus]